ncbi:MAG: pseudouridine-5'-phosphate glycosidase [Chloroflexi bacterium]|nr:MAG: pseudouridine-5'-phosphate glycosidase [Chloroflexota bacterium]
MSLSFVFHPEVEEALRAHRPVVALESTLITHGFPAPDNLTIAREIEAAVRQAGAVPATIAILEGQITVGLTEAQLEALAASPDVRKCSRRDLPLAVARRENGATTVAGTMVIAHRAGIRVFATGGIGGVHRNHPFDESADLMELSQTPITVVCAGAKAILDLPLTLEVLETNGVPILGYQTDELPAFYSRHSGLPVDVRVDSVAEVVEIIRARDGLGLSAGVLVTVPVPADDEWPAAQAQQVIDQALTEAEQLGITGKAVTPFLLQKIAELSGGRSKQANRSLLLNNARLAARIAQALES